jgi:hypothetical protein
MYIYSIQLMYLYNKSHMIPCSMLRSRAYLVSLVFLLRERKKKIALDFMTLAMVSKVT